MSLEESIFVTNAVGCATGKYLVDQQGEFIWRDFDLNRELRAGSEAGINQALAFLCAADLSQAVLRGILPPINLAGVDLRGADLRGADLRDVTFIETVNIGGQLLTIEATLNGVIYDSETRWPRGFTPPPSAVP
jgi:uncharacterized protein YjbI with pentapeptide repeats